jgi:RimJ/RimL family protein N-acetyltransferase
MVESAEVIVNELTGRRGREIRSLVPATRLAPARLEGVRRLYAGSRARRVRVRTATRDGRGVLLRSIRPADRERLRRFDADLSDGSRRLRYLGFMPPMAQDWAAQLAAPDFDRRFAFVAVAGNRLVGDCRLVPTDDGQEELALVVADDYQGSGLGRSLLGLALRTAAERGAPAVVAEVRYDNERMTRLLRSFGFKRTAWDLGVMTFRWVPPRAKG